MNVLDALVEQASLASGDAAPLRSFTASAQAGVLAMRRASRPWAFATTLLRAARQVPGRCVARLRIDVLDGQRVMRFDLRQTSDDWSWIDLTGLLEAALRDDVTDPPSVRWRSLIGAAVNGALAMEPRAVELHTPAGARRWTLGDATSDADPYVLQRMTSDVEDGGVSLVIRHRAEGVSAIWARWTGRHEPEEEVARAWSEALGKPVDGDALGDGVVVESLAERESVWLGTLGRWWPAESGGLFLRRDGVRIAEFSQTVSAQGGPALHGDVEADGLGLDVDGRAVRTDAALHGVIAWLAAPELVPPAVVTDSHGQARALETLRSTDEVVFVWPHQAEAAAHVGHCTVLTPPQLQWLTEHTEATLVPADVLLEAKAPRRVDLTGLHEGSVGPVGLGEVEGARVEAFVHRHPVAHLGRVEVHGFGRVVFEASAELVGVTVVCTMPAGGVDVSVAATLAEGAVERATACADLLTQAVLSALPEGPARARVPWYAHRLRRLSPAGIELHYRAHGDGVRLAWRDEPLLQLTVAHERDGTPRTAAEALERLRDVGGIVVGEPGGRWVTLESSVPAWVPWLLTEAGATLLGQLVGDSGLWRMPMVPEAQLRPASLASQFHVRLRPARATELREQLHSVGRAREWSRRALSGHALWARASGEDALELDRLPLVVVYDPRAAQPRRRQSIEAIASASIGGVVPPGAGHRGLPQPVVEAGPAVAHALVELGLVAASTAHIGRAKSEHRPTPRAAETRTVWLRQRIVDERVVGALTLAEGPPGVEVWREGLRHRTVVLARPFSSVSGRVWLQGAGGSDGTLRPILQAEASLLATAARRAVLLAVPGSARARALRAFVLGLPEPPKPQPPAHTVVLGSDRLAATLRYALGRSVMVEVSRVSWSLVRDDEGLQRVRLGGLHPLVRAARSDDASASDIGAAALAALVVLHRAERVSLRQFDQGVERVLAALE